MKNSTARLGTDSVIKLVFRLTLPAVAAQLITFLYNAVDRVYVAKIENAGMDALAAIGVVLPVTLIMQAFANLVGMGGSPRASMRLGEGNESEANGIFNTSALLLCTLSVILGGVCFLFARQIVTAFGCPPSALPYATEYLKIYALGTPFVLAAQGLNPFITAQGFSFAAMISVLFGALLNVALDPLFIFVFGMGVRGASLATVLSQAASCVWILSFFFSKKSGLSFCVSQMKFDKTRLKGILSLGVSPFVMTITECAIQIVFNVNLNRATGGNGDYTAALTVMLSALQLISLPLNGMGYGMQPFVSYNYGKGDAKRLKEGVRAVTVEAFVFAVSVWGVSLAAPGLYAKVFSASPAVADIVVRYTPLFLMGSVMFFVQMTLQNINVALGQAKSALALAVLRKVIILIPLCFVLAHFLGAKGVYLSEGVADLIAGTITSVTFLITFPRVYRACAGKSAAGNSGEELLVAGKTPDKENEIR